MPGKKLSQLTETQSLSNDDLIYVVDVSAATNAKSKGITRENLGNTLNIGQSLPSRIISGGMEWVSGLTWESVNLVYEINGVQHVITDGTQVTLDAADPTNPRIDVIYGDDTGTLGKETGTAAGSPSKPSIEEWQLELTFATVAATATVPTGISNTDIYLENAGQPSEWDATESTSGVRIDTANTTSPLTGSTDIKVLSSLTSGDYIEFTHSTSINVNQFKFLRFNLKLGTAWDNDFFIVQLRSGSTVISRRRSGAFVDDTNITSTQEITIFYYEFSNFQAATFDTIRIIFRNRGNIDDLQIDDMIAQIDTNLPPAPEVINAADVVTDTTNFDTNLSSADTDVQKALETIDDLALGGGGSLPVDDTTAVVRDPVDNTKLVRIDAGNVAATTTRTITMPDADVTLGNLLDKTGDTMTGDLTAADHNTGTNARVVGITYGTGSPPTASSTPIGTLFIQYTP